MFSSSVFGSVVAGLPIGDALVCDFFAGAVFFVVSVSGADFPPIGVLRGFRSVAIVYFGCCIGGTALSGALGPGPFCNMGVFGVCGFSVGQGLSAFSLVASGVFFLIWRR